jgi:glycosidase
MGSGFYSFTADLPAGAYFYKIAVNGSWAENYGLGGNFDGANVQLNLEKPQRVTFYYNDATHRIANSTEYTMLKDADLPYISIGGADKIVMRDTMLDEFYTAKAKLTAGSYEVKIAQDGKKDETMQVAIRKDGETAFYYDAKTHQLIADDGSIDESKIVHDTWDLDYRAPFAAIPTGEKVKLSLRAKAGDLNNVKLELYKAKITADGGDEYNIDYKHGLKYTYKMKKVKTRDNIDTWTVKVSPQTNGVWGYKFILNNSKEYGDDAKMGNTGIVSLRDGKPFQLTVYDKNYKTPDWAKEAVVYQIFPDRFFNGDKENDYARESARGSQPIQHRAWSDVPANFSKTPDLDGDEFECNDFYGGDLAGITQKLDYLQKLGITAIYVNPIMNACSNHRYDAVSYETLDPLLGSMDDFRTLAAEMKKRNIRLIMDGVFNHVGDDSIYFDRYGKYSTVGAYEFWSRVYDLMNEKNLSEDAAKKEARRQLSAEGQGFSPYHFENWFEVKNEKTADSMGEKYAYHDWQGYSSLVPFKDFAPYEGAPVMTAPNQLNNKDLTKYLVTGEDAVMVKWFREGLSGWRLDVAKEVSPEFWAKVRSVVKKEKTLDGSEPLLLGEIWQDGSQFLTGDQFDSVMNYKLSFAVGDLFLNRGDAAAADDELKVLQQNYPKEALYDLMNIVDSHDTVRAIYKFGGGAENAAIARLSDFDYELGKKRLKLAAIFLMGYPGMPTIYYGDEAGVFGSADPDCRRTYPWGSEDKELIDFYTKVIFVRNNNKKLFAHGDVNTLFAEGDCYAYERTAKNEAAIVALNRGAAKTLELSVKYAEGTEFGDALDEGYKAVVKDGRLTLKLGENQGRMMLKKQ